MEESVHRQITKIYQSFYVLRSLYVLSIAIYYTSFARALKDIISDPALAATCTIALIATSLFFDTYFEAWTGKFADVTGRRKALVLYAVSFVVSAIMMMVATDPRGGSLARVVVFGCLGQLLFMLGGAFLSGSLEAWAIDAVDEVSKRTSSGLMFSRATIWEGIMWLIGGAVNIYVFHPPTDQANRTAPIYPWLAIIALMIITIGFVEFYLGDEQVRPATTRESFAIFMRRVWSDVTSSKQLYLLTIAYATSYVLWISVAYLWVSAYEEIAKSANVSDTTAFAWIFFCIARLVASFLVNRMRSKKLFTGKMLAFATAINVLPMIAAGWIAVQALAGHQIFSWSPKQLLIWFFASIVVAKLGEEVVKPIRRTLLNDAVPDARYRATINSLSNSVGGLVALLAFGAGFAVLSLANVTSNINVASTLLAVSLFAAISLPLYLALGKHPSPVHEAA